MSSENVEVVRGTQVAVNQRGSTALGESFHPDIVHRAIEGAVDDAGEMHGIDAIRGYYQDWIDMFDDLTTEVGDACETRAAIG